MKLRMITEINEAKYKNLKSPKIVRTLSNPATVFILFKNGDIWKYIINDGAFMNYLLNTYERNVGGLVAKLKSHKTIEAIKVKSGT